MLLFIAIYSYLRQKIHFMKRYNYSKSLLFACATALLLSTFSACKKDEKTPDPQIELQLPSQLSLLYGEEKDLTLPGSLAEHGDVSLRLEYAETENITISGTTKLHDKLSQAFTIQKNQNKIHINSNVLYPNGVVSIKNGIKIPDTYKVTVVATAANGTLVGRQTVGIKVSPAKVSIKGVQNNGETPFSYVLYNDKGASFELDALKIPTTGTSWFLPKQENGDTAVSIDGNHIKFAVTAGDPHKQAEKKYDLAPALLKDGFPVASTPFQVIFIPQIKFFFGMYYPEHNLTIRLNLIHIGLSNGYVSTAPTLYPDKYKSSFSLVSVEKDGKAFTDSNNTFAVNASTGVVTVKKDDALKAGSYKFIIKAVTTTGLTFETDLTLAMSGE
ncbi:Uncharacterised protein [Sphingobacterium spiritivorum]|uniref:Uncharacterized protein n=2 Tax=Sphingobacterium spiritivorum TaxID=258 RepID=D7VIN8_SPHSI|nr:hypothetical protein HMPREF0766_10857 [Sphingobacterium spiritivorum ATCC 33861]SUI97042.1 Uncharacterised protein [Sphingobacterium spiritivorum]